MNEYDFKRFGFEIPLQIIGSLDIIREEENLPTVLLFDEHHENLNNCIDKNIVNAIELISKGNVNRIGVESLAGGKSWDSQNQVYSDNYPDKKFDDKLASTYTSSSVKFAVEVRKYNSEIIYGVESFGMMHRLSLDFDIDNSNVSSHPLHKERSKHFIQTLFENYDFKNGNIFILNCGSNHNDHIEEWVANGEIDKIVGIKANYIRINTVN